MKGDKKDVKILVHPRTFPIADEEKPRETCKVVINLLAIEKWK